MENQNETLKHELKTREDLFSILWDCKIYLANLFIVVFVVWFSAQGKDLLVGVTEKAGFEGHLLAASFLLFLLFLAIMNWHTPRYHYSDNIQFNRSEIQGKKSILAKSWHYLYPASDSNHRKEMKAEEWKKNSVLVPRWLGVVTIQTVGFAILQVYYENKIGGNQFLAEYMFYIFAASSVISYFLLRALEKFYEYASEYTKSRIETVIYLGIFVVILLLFTKSLTIRSFAFGVTVIIVSILFGLIVTLRNRDNKLFKFVRDWQLTKFFMKRSPRLAHIVTTTTLGMGLVFIFINFFPINLNRFYPLLILLIALIFYTSLFSNIVYFIRLKGWTFNKYLILMLVTVSIFLSECSSDLHNIRLVYSSVDSTERDSIDTYFTSWLESNRGHIETYLSDTINDHEKYPIFLCANEGGGSRAAYWTNLVLTNLHNSTNGDFLKHCFAMSSASGGTFGSASFTSFLEDTSSYNFPNDSSSFTERVNIIHKRNYLSRSLANLLGKDLFKYLMFSKAFKPDRAELQELEWSKGVEMGIKRVDKLDSKGSNAFYFEKPFLSFWYGKETEKYRKPLLFINTTEVEQGIRGVVSPVAMDFSKGIDILDGIHRTAPDQGLSLRMSTSALMSARFPFVNPGGKIENLGTFVDGGYYDNIGGTTILEVLDECEKVIENVQDSLFAKIEFHVIMITNSSQSQDSNPKNFSQILIPPSTIVATQSGHTRYFKQELIERFPPESFHHIEIKQNETKILIGDPEFNNTILEKLYGTKDYRPIIPLARYLSESSVKGIQANIDLNCDELNELVQLVSNKDAFCNSK